MEVEQWNKFMLQIPFILRNLKINKKNIFKSVFVNYYQNKLRFIMLQPGALLPIF